MGSEEEKLELLGMWASPFVQRVKWVLKLKGIEYTYTEEDLTNKSQRLLNLNPIHKMVPVLIHNGKPILESWVIIEYIEETWKHNPLFPVDDPYQIAMARFWGQFLEEKLTEGIRRVLMSEGEKKEKEVKQVIESFDVLEGELNGKKYFGGDKVGIVDIVLGSILVCVDVVEEIASVKMFDSQKHSSLGCWRKTFAELPGVEGDSPSKDDLVAYALHRIT
ncbi:Glutathione S-transferase, C-terminal [Dillenia turbinata]|uniref:glutathione transferase n=1 Tax=Dillenia turbinata TaxID=194707 RepID=A0AAN8ZJH3_9MAGN